MEILNISPNAKFIVLAAYDKHDVYHIAALDNVLSYTPFPALIYLASSCNGSELVGYLETQSVLPA
jgi:hypothetical protein